MAFFQQRFFGGRRWETWKAVELPPLWGMFRSSLMKTESFFTLRFSHQTGTYPTASPVLKRGCFLIFPIFRNRSVGHDPRSIATGPNDLFTPPIVQYGLGGRAGAIGRFSQILALKVLVGFGGGGNGMPRYNPLLRGIERRKRFFPKFSAPC